LGADGLSFVLACGLGLRNGNWNQEIGMKNIWKLILVVMALVCSVSAGATQEWVRGELVKLAPQKLQVTVRHEAVKSMGMDAMTMPYAVSDAAVLKGFKVGDAVRFTIVMQGEQMRIGALEHAR
jgi:Cu/Ag efflux protein CusF